MEYKHRLLRMHRGERTQRTAQGPSLPGATGPHASCCCAAPTGEKRWVPVAHPAGHVGFSLSLIQNEPPSLPILLGTATVCSLHTKTRTHTVCGTPLTDSPPPHSCCCDSSVHCVLHLKCQSCGSALLPWTPILTPFHASSPQLSGPLRLHLHPQIPFVLLSEIPTSHPQTPLFNVPTNCSLILTGIWTWISYVSHCLHSHPFSCGSWGWCYRPHFPALLWQDDASPQSAEFYKDSKTRRLRPPSSNIFSLHCPCLLPNSQASLWKICHLSHSFPPPRLPLFSTTSTSAWASGARGAPCREIGLAIWRLRGCCLPAVTWEESMFPFSFF